MRTADNFEPIRKKDTVIGRFWSQAHRQAAKRDAQVKRDRRARAFFAGNFLGSVAIALTLGLGTVSAAPAGPTHTDARCTQVLRDWNYGIDSADADWLANYIGCDEVYNAKGTLVGFGKGKTVCERRAYRGNFIHHLINAEFDAYMTKGDCGNLNEDLSWSQD